MRSLQRFEYSQLRMGVETRIVVYAPEEAIALRACQEAYSRISALEEKMSDYRRDSELMQVCERAVGRWVKVSPELFYVLWRAQRLAQQTEGAFDITVGPLVALWRETRRTQRLPDPQALAEARARSGWHKLQLSLSRRAVRLQTEGMRLDLGGIAKGYACDQALRVLRKHGLNRALVQMGGDLVVGDPPPSLRLPSSTADKGTAFSFTFWVNTRVFQQFQPSPPAPLLFSPHPRPLSQWERGVWLPPSPCGRGRGGVGEGLSRRRDKGFRSETCTRAFEVEPRLCTLTSPSTGGTENRQTGWQIEVPALKQNGQPIFLSLQRCALSTSGSTEQYVEIEGTRYAHIVDPRTGLGLTHLVLASVRAPDGITADSLATALCVMGESGVALLKRFYRPIEVWLQQA